ncbi:MAG: sensor histidine kinase N-terminal domain-containing protein, partial [Chloroflexota bacterium]
MSIRDRLTIIYTAIFLGAFLLFTFVVYLLPRVTLLGEIDQTLEETAAQMLEETQVFSQQDVLSLFLPAQDDSPFRGANIFIMVVDDEGNILRRSDNLQGFTSILDAQGIQQSEEGFRTLSHDGQPVRVLTVPLRVDRGGEQV